MNTRVAVRPKPAGGARRASRPVVRRPGPRPAFQADAERPLAGTGVLPELEQVQAVAEAPTTEPAVAPYTFGTIPLFPPAEQAEVPAETDDVLAEEALAVEPAAEPAVTEPTASTVEPAVSPMESAPSVVEPAAEPAGIESAASVIEPTAEPIEIESAASAVEPAAEAIGTELAAPAVELVPRHAEAEVSPRHPEPIRQAQGNLREPATSSRHPERSEPANEVEGSRRPALRIEIPPLRSFLAQFTLSLPNGVGKTTQPNTHHDQHAGVLAASQVESAEIAVEAAGDASLATADVVSAEEPAEAVPADEPAAVEQTTDALSALDRAVAEPGEPLPHRAALEKKLGRPLGGLRVHSGVASGEALADLDAEAATLGQHVFLAEPSPPVDVVAHEVVHALQAGPDDGTPRVGGAVVTVGDPAEREAEQLTRQVLDQGAALGKREPREHLPDGSVALLRTSSAPTVPPGSAATPSAAFAAATGPSGNRPPSAAPSTVPGGATPPPARQPSTAPATTAPAGGETAPTLELPAPPPPGLTPEDVAAQQQAAAEAEAALAAAGTVTGLVDTFAGAPPSVMARHASALGSDTDRLSKSEEAEFQGSLPELHAELSGEVPAAETVEIPAPAARDVTLEATTPPPAPLPELPPTVDAGAYTANDGLARELLRHLTGEPGERAGEVGQALQDVQTTDPEIETSAGPPPQVPLEGESDPERIAQQQEEGVGQARTARTEAQQAVLDGPGPELVQPRVMDEAYPIGELAAPALQPTPPLEGPEAFLAMGVTPDVQAAFDQQQQAAMQASLQGPRAEIETAGTERDTKREAEVAKAESDVQTLTVEADSDQRTQVQESRELIQQERGTTLEAQQQAVADAEASVEDERKLRKGEIDDRVTDDEQQIRDRYEQADKDAKDEVRKGEAKAEDERRDAERDAEEESWWDRAVSFVKDAFEALTSAIGAIFDAVRDAVNGILDAVKTFALELIDAVAGFIKDAIALFGEFLKAAVDALLGEIFPELAAALKEKIDGAVTFAQQAVDVVADGLKAGVSAIVDGLKAGLNAIIDIYQAAVELGLSLVEAAITGDWSGLARKLLEAALKVAGISPEEFYAFIGRAEETFQLILDDPGQFLSNCVDAFIGGVQKFADAFLTHLQTGVIEWLTGTMSGAGITLPERFDLLGVLDIARQILGLTWEHLRARAVKLVGEKNVERIEFVADYLKSLIVSGWTALLEQISESLSGLRDMVMESLKGYLLEKIVISAITRLATLFNPVGALVQLVLAAWNLFTFLRDNLARIAEVLKTVVEAIGDIARGVIDPATKKVEGILGKLLPLALDLLARFLGLTGISKKIQEIIEGIRERVNKAIDKLIEKVMGRFKGKGAADKAKPAAPQAKPPAQQPADKKPDDKKPEADAAGVPKDLVAKSVVRLPEVNPALSAEIEKASSGTVIYKAAGSPLEITRKLLRENPDARFDQKSGALTLPAFEARQVAPAHSLRELGQLLGAELDVARLVLRKTDRGFEIDAQINPDEPILSGTEVELQTEIGMRGADGSVVATASFQGSMEETLLYFRTLQWGPKNITLDQLKGNRNYALANISVSGVSEGGVPVMFARPIANVTLLTVFSSGQGEPTKTTAKVKVPVVETGQANKPNPPAKPDENIEVGLFIEPPRILIANEDELKKFIEKIKPVLEVPRDYNAQPHRHSEQVVWQLIRLNQDAIAAWIDMLEVQEITQFAVNIHSEREMCRNCAAASNYMLANMADELKPVWEALKRRRAKQGLLMPEAVVSAAVPFSQHAPRLSGVEAEAKPRPGVLVDQFGRPLDPSVRVVGHEQVKEVERPKAVAPVQTGVASKKPAPSDAPELQKEKIRELTHDTEQGIGPKGEPRRIIHVGDAGKKKPAPLPAPATPSTAQTVPVSGEKAPGAPAAEVKPVGTGTSGQPIPPQGEKPTSQAGPIPETGASEGAQKVLAPTPPVQAKEGTGQKVEPTQPPTPAIQEKPGQPVQTPPVTQQKPPVAVPPAVPKPVQPAVPGPAPKPELHELVPSGKPATPPSPEPVPPTVPPAVKKVPGPAKVTPTLVAEPEKVVPPAAPKPAPAGAAEKVSGTPSPKPSATPKAPAPSTDTGKPATKKGAPAPDPKASVATVASPPAPPAKKGAPTAVETPEPSPKPKAGAKKSAVSAPAPAEKKKAAATAADVAPAPASKPKAATKKTAPKVSATPPKAASSKAASAKKASSSKGPQKKKSSAAKKKATT